MNELCLFAGAGGGLLATQHLLGFRTVCYVEIDDYCQRVLQARIRDGLLDDAPIWDDVRTFDGRPWRGCVDIITAGFPCQPFSTVGQQWGEQDARNLWPETIRVIREVGPRFCLLENVPNLLAHEYYGTILGDLAEGGLAGPWDVLSAAQCDGPHRGDRLWIVATSPGERCEASEDEARKFTEGLCSQGTPENWGGVRASLCESPRGSRRRIRLVPDGGILRMGNGVAPTLDRLRALGNGQVPIVAATAWKLLSERRSDDD
jgi:DNA (cytosine-5)-methyltransferase 1